MTKIAELCGIRVWRGYRAESFLDNLPSFVDKLKTIFIPQTAQQMMPLGLQAYFPAILPEHTDVQIPDEIALVVYPSNSAYEKATRHSVAGRAYGLLHSTVFNFSRAGRIPPSTSDFPVPWVDGWQWDQSYALLPHAIDWQMGSTLVLMAKPAQNLGAANFCRLLNEAVASWLARRHGDIDGSILCVNRHWVLYWEHRQGLVSESGHKDSFTEELLPILEQPLINTVAKSLSVPPAFTQADEGVECTPGELLCLRIDCQPGLDRPDRQR